MTEQQTMNDVERLKEFVVIWLIKFAGACERPRISKKDIQSALINLQKEVDKWKP